MTSVRFSKMVFGSVFCTVCRLMCMALEMTYFRANLVQLIVSRSDSEIWHKEKYVDCWSYHAATWTVNETTWKTVPKPPKSVFWKPNRGNRVFVFLKKSFFLNFELSSVFRKPISEIFIGFCTPLMVCDDKSGCMRQYVSQYPIPESV